MMKPSEKILQNKGTCPTEQTLIDYYLGRLSPAENRQIEQHLIDCESCSDFIDGLSNYSSIEEYFADLADINQIIDIKNKKNKNRFSTFYLATAASVIIAVLLITIQIVQKKPNILADAPKLHQEEVLPFGNKKTLKNDSPALKDDRIVLKEKPVDITGTTKYKTEESANISEDCTNKDISLDIVETELSDVASGSSENIPASNEQPAQKIISSLDGNDQTIVNDRLYTTSTSDKKREKKDSDKQMESLAETIGNRHAATDESSNSEIAAGFFPQKAERQEKSAGAEILYFDALNLFNAKNYDQSLNTLKQINKDDIYYWDAKLLEAKIMICFQRFEEAKHILNKIIKNSNSSVIDEAKALSDTLESHNE